MKQHRDRGVRDSCAHPAEGDGANPKFDRDDGTHRASHWKDRQLERISARAIEAVLVAHPRAIDWGLRLAAIDSVPGGSTLRASVVWDAAVSDVDVRGLLAALQGACRAALARALNRKRVPVVCLVALGRVHSDPKQTEPNHEEQR